MLFIMGDTMNSVDNVLEKIVRYQKEHDFSDQQMAEKIGCSRPLYQRTRTGRISVGGTFLKGAMKLLVPSDNGRRTSVVRRTTRETDINLELNIDGTGKWEIATGNHIFDHLLSAMIKHGLFDIKLKAVGDDAHHLVEDVAICLGRAFSQALGDKKGIVRMADATVPMDDALAAVAVDFGGRGYAVLDLPFAGNDMSGLLPDLIRHFLESFAIEARMNLHARILVGTNDHHKAEALLKALGRALDAAARIDPRIAGEIPSTKELLER
jgi:imidazoleglycerol-phosphate dehydratase